MNEETHGRHLRRLGVHLRKTATALLCLLNLPTVGAGKPTPLLQGIPAADTRLWIEKRRWLENQDEFNGYETRVTILKNKCAPTAGHRVVSLTFRESEDIESL